MGPEDRPHYHRGLQADFLLREKWQAEHLHGHGDVLGKQIQAAKALMRHLGDHPPPQIPAQISRRLVPSMGFGFTSEARRIDKTEGGGNDPFSHWPESH
jgi:hypothetical protein